IFELQLSVLPPHKDSALEETRFEPLVPLATEMLIELARGITHSTRMLAVGDTGPVPRFVLTPIWDRRFESGFLQRRVSNELFWRWASMGPLPGRLRPELCGCWRKIADQGRIMTKQLARPRHVRPAARL